MKKYLPLIIIGGLAVLFIGGRVLTQKGIPLAPIKKPISPDQETTPAEESFTGKLKDVLSLGQSMKCTWQKDENNYGTSFIKNQNIYTEVIVDGKKMHSLIVNDCTYTWEEGKDIGFKMCFEEEKEEEVSLPEEFSWETPDISYSCVKTTVTDSMFNPPRSVTFIGPKEIIKP